jgi:hypothetical protein
MWLEVLECRSRRCRSAAKNTIRPPPAEASDFEGLTGEQHER